MEQIKAALRAKTTEMVEEVAAMLAAVAKPTTEQRMVLAAAIDIYAERLGVEAADLFMDALGL